MAHKLGAGGGGGRKKNWWEILLEEERDPRGTPGHAPAVATGFDPAAILRGEETDRPAANIPESPSVPTPASIDTHTFEDARREQRDYRNRNRSRPRFRVAGGGGGGGVTTTHTFEDARREQRDYMNRNRRYPQTPTQDDTSRAQMVSNLLRGEAVGATPDQAGVTDTGVTDTRVEGAAAGVDQVTGTGESLAQPSSSFRQNWNELNRITEQAKSSPDTAALVAGMTESYLADFDAFEQKIMAMFAEQNQAIDPATKAALAELREQAQVAKKDLLEGLAARGLGQSGILREMQLRLNKNELTASQQLLAGRVREIQNRMTAAVMQLAQMRLSGLQTWGLARLQAAESAADRQQRRNLSLLGSAIDLSRLGLGADQFNRDLAERQRQYDVGQSRWQQEFDVGQSRWQQEFDFRVRDAGRTYELRKDAMSAEERGSYADDLAQGIQLINAEEPLQNVLDMIGSSRTTEAYQGQLSNTLTNYHDRTPHGWLDNHYAEFGSKDEMLNWLQGTEGANRMIRHMGVGPYSELLQRAGAYPENAWAEVRRGWYARNLSPGGIIGGVQLPPRFQ